MRKTCSSCGQQKEAKDFRVRADGRRNQCKECFNAWRRAWRKKVGIPKLTPGQRKRKNFMTRKRRMDPARRAYIIVMDSSRNDDCKGRDNDLDIDFVEVLISKGCAYCGVSRDDCQITLDRIDNNIGHLKTNVNPSCFTCNLTRGTMPYKAWLMVSRALREARTLGLLDGWSLQPIRRRYSNESA